MTTWLQRLYRLAVAAFLTAGVVWLGPAPQSPVTVWSSIWVFLICWLWAGFAGQIGQRAWQLVHAPRDRAEVALSLTILSLGFCLIVLLWLGLAGVLGFWRAVLAMVPVFGIYALIDWIVRHRDDFDTSIKP
ncbi:MAG: hypothetical protein WA921_00370 [Ahrensia sp.]